jgi:hypothetical protein
MGIYFNNKIFNKGGLILRGIFSENKDYLKRNKIDTIITLGKYKFYKKIYFFIIYYYI